MKNMADAEKAKAEDELKQLEAEAERVAQQAQQDLADLTAGQADRKKELESILRKAEFDRSVAKLLLNSLLGRLNIKIDRTQTLITKSVNDVVCALGDRANFNGADIEPFLAGDDEVFRCRFEEGDYYDHVQQFDVVPYITAYMLGYSKMLMQCSFQFLAEIGAEALYTDSDSIAFAATEEQYEQYAERFVPSHKTFGGRELEGVFSRLVALGPKKYITIKEDGSYHWNANGMPAKCNSKLTCPPEGSSEDVLAKFEKVLTDRVVEQVDYFSISHNFFELRHSVGAKKNLRFICLKGPLLDDGRSIGWWQDEAEFEAYARSLKPIGWDVEEEKEVDEEAAVVEPDPEPIDDVDDAEAVGGPTRRPSAKRWQRKRRHDDAKEVEGEQSHTKFRVYILNCPETGDGYVGATTDPIKRLKQHNRELPGGAKETAGRQWEYYAQYAGFQNFREALKFESAIKDYHQVASVGELDAIAQNLIDTRQNFAGYKKVPILA